MQMRWAFKWGALLGSVLLPFAVWAADNPPVKSPGVPGTVNYVEGQVRLAGKELNASAIGSAIVDPGQSIDTQNGKAELLLTPGVFFRLGDNSSATMLSAGLTNTELELDSGQAILEVAQIYSENNLRVKEGGLTAHIDKPGLYEFDMSAGLFRVFEGEAEVDAVTHHVTLKSGHQVAAGTDGTLVTSKFDRKDFETGDLYNWSSLRSSYEAEANVNEASYYEQYGGVPGGPAWWGAGWYWDPWFSAYTFLPGDGIFCSPFGWGFYSPWWVDRAPFYGRGFGYGRFGFNHHFNTNPTTWGPGQHYAMGQHYVNGTYNGPGMVSGAFHSGGRFTVAGGFRASTNPGSHGNGGFHGSVGSHGGGFHGGGFGGGGHGGGGGGHGGR